MHANTGGLAMRSRHDGLDQISIFRSLTAEQRADVQARCVWKSFAEQQTTHPTRQRGRVLVALLAATDVYVWKLLRRDLCLDRKASESAVGRLVRGALVNEKGK